MLVRFLFFNREDKSNKSTTSLSFEFTHTIKVLGKQFPSFLSFLTSYMLFLHRNTVALTTKFTVQFVSTPRATAVYVPTTCVFFPPSFYLRHVHSAHLNSVNRSEPVRGHFQPSSTTRRPECVQCDPGVTPLMCNPGLIDIPCSISLLFVRCCCYMPCRWGCHGCVSYPERHKERQILISLLWFHGSNHISGWYLQLEHTA